MSSTWLLQAAAVAARSSAVAAALADTATQSVEKPQVEAGQQKHHLLSLLAHTQSQSAEVAQVEPMLVLAQVGQTAFSQQ